MKRLTMIGMVFLLGCAEAPNRQPGASFDRGDREAILRAVLHDVLTNPQLERTRSFYGGTDGGSAALVSGAPFGIDWPDEFDPAVVGREMSFLAWPSSRDPSRPRLLGIVLSRFDLPEQASVAPSRAPIEVQLMNVGGNADGAVAGRCFVYYKAAREGEGWTAVFSGAAD